MNNLVAPGASWKVHISNGSFLKGLVSRKAKAVYQLLETIDFSLLDSIFRDYMEEIGHISSKQDTFIDLHISLTRAEYTSVADSHLTIGARGGRTSLYPRHHLYRQENTILYLIHEFVHLYGTRRWDRKIRNRKVGLVGLIGGINFNEGLTELIASEIFQEYKKKSLIKDEYRPSEALETLVKKVHNTIESLANSSGKSTEEVSRLLKRAYFSGDMNLEEFLQAIYKEKYPTLSEQDTIHDLFY